ncbi:MAG: hypothetical protein Q7S27_02055 [Nanoarchaeota archaeon]|nr:hypothetical protein [Nanoarchaeota archaeon]
MKRGFELMLIIFFISSVTAISSDLKSNYERGETIIAKISGEILETLNNDQVEFKRWHISVPIIYDLKKIGQDYYFWASAPTSENNYSLTIKGITTRVDGKIEEIDFMHNFSISGNLTDYSVEPGIISTGKDFEINVQLNEDFSKEINIDFPEQRTFTLKPGKNIVKFSLSSINKSEFRKINVGKYSIPVNLIFSEKNSSTLNQSERINIRFEPSSIVSTVLFGDKVIYPFKIVNFGDESIDNLIIEYNNSLFILSGNNFSIEKQETLELNLTLSNGIAESLKIKGIDEKIKIVYQGNEVEMPIVIRFTENKNETNTPYLTGEKSYYCSELNGLVCSAGEQCEGEIKTSIDGTCCVGKCIIPKEGKSWISYLIAIGILLILIYLFIRYRKVKSGDAFKKRVSSAEEKMKKLP